MMYLARCPLGRSIAIGLTVMAGVLFAAGCIDPMQRQPRYDPLEPSRFFANGMASRPTVPGTIARGQLQLDTHFTTGMVDGELAREFPQTILDRDPAELLARGQQQFDIFCAPCHDRLGNGQGMVPRRGFPSPPSYHMDRLRSAPIGHFFDVSTNGFGRMPSYRDRIRPEDRWAIAAYIRALQFSQHVPAAELGADDLQNLAPETASP